MGTKFKVPSGVRCTLPCINLIAVLTAIPFLIPSSAHPFPAQPAKVVFPIRTYHDRNSNANNSTSHVEISALHSNAFNFTSTTTSTSKSTSASTTESAKQKEIDNFADASINNVTISSSRKRDFGALPPLEKLFSNITSNNTSPSSSISISITTPAAKLVPLVNHIPPSSEQKQLKSSMKPQFKKANVSSSPPGRIDPALQTKKILHSKSRFNSSTSAVNSTTEPIRRVQQTTLPPGLRRSNNSSALRNPGSILQRRANESSENVPEKRHPGVASPVVVDPEEVIRQALLNHTLMHGAEEDLDRLVFSQLPEGSKLILRSVKIVKTDENGDTVEDDDDTAATAWDVTIANATDSVYDAEEGGETEDSEEDDEEDDEPETNKNVQPNVNKNDLLSAGSHESHSTANYKVYGNNLRHKEKTKNYHHGNDHGKHHKKTLTDTDGVKVTNYHGKEKGLTDFANSHGNAQSNEGGRYKDSKKKNKGRKVTGFKRVYHKEEFQRTEHFYDDEEAKRIAENYSLTDHKEKSAHGDKDDDRKYHGTRKEITDGNKVKNEYGTKNSYDKGQHESHADSEKHKHSNHYGNSKNSRYSSPQDNSYHHGEKNYHPNHNYKAAYSNTAPVLRPQPSSSPPPGNDRTNNIRKLVATPPVSSFTVTEYIQPDSTEDSIVLSHSAPSQSDSSSFLADIHHDEPDPTLVSSPAPLEKPSEMKVFFSPRERPIPLENEIAIEETPYAPNFGPQTQKTHIHAPLELPFRHSHNHYRRPHNHRSRPVEDAYGGQQPPLRFMDTPFFNKIGNATYSPPDINIVDNTILFENNDKDNERYSDNYQTTTIRHPEEHDVQIDPVPAVYSTIVKVLPTQFYNYTDFHNAASNIIVPPDSNLISIDKAKVDEIIITTPSPRHGNHHNLAKWTSYSHENGQESKQHPNHNYGNEPPAFRGPRKRIPAAHLARLHHRRRNRPILSSRPSGPGASPQPHFNGNNNNLQHQSSNAVLYKSRRAPFPGFMNGLMDSVANFFSKIG